MDNYFYNKVILFFLPIILFSDDKKDKKITFSEKLIIILILFLMNDKNKKIFKKKCISFCSFMKDTYKEIKEKTKNMGIIDRISKSSLINPSNSSIPHPEKNNNYYHDKDYYSKNNKYFNKNIKLYIKKNKDIYKQEQHDKHDYKQEHNSKNRHHKKYNINYNDTIKNLTANNIDSELITSKEIRSDKIEVKEMCVVSDMRKKTNIVHNPLSSDLLDNINMVSFEYKDDDENHIGFLAQDIEKYYPQLVKTDSEGFLSVKYLEMIPLIIDYNQNLKKDMIELEKRIK